MRSVVAATIFSLSRTTIVTHSRPYWCIVVGSRGFGKPSRNGAAIAAIAPHASEVTGTSWVDRENHND